MLVVVLVSSVGTVVDTVGAGSTMTLVVVVVLLVVVDGGSCATDGRSLGWKRLDDDKNLGGRGNLVNGDSGTAAFVVGVMIGWCGMVDRAAGCGVWYNVVVLTLSSLSS